MHKNLNILKGVRAWTNRKTNRIQKHFSTFLESKKQIKGIICIKQCFINNPKFKKVRYAYKNRIALLDINISITKLNINLRLQILEYLETMLEYHG